MGSPNDVSQSLKLSRFPNGSLLKSSSETSQEVYKEIVFIRSDGKCFAATLKTRAELGPGNFRRDFWDGTKYWPIADRLVPSNNPRNNCGRYFDYIFLLVSKVANVRKRQRQCGE